MRTPVVRPLLAALLVLGAWSTLEAVAQGSRRLVVVPRTGPLAGRQLYTNSHALLVGVARYQHLPKDRWLQFADRDASELRDVLVRSYGFAPENVSVLLDEQATKAKIEGALASFANDEKVKRDDRLLVFFSGHGQTVRLASGGEMGFLIPYDASVDLNRPENPGPYLATCLPMDHVWSYLEGSPAKHALVLADACYGGLLARSRQLGEKPAPPVIAGLLTRPALQVMTAGSRDEIAFEDPRWGHGAFTYKLLEELRARAATADTVFLASELAAALKVSVGNVTNARQTPQFGNYNNTEGEFLFVTAAAPVLADGTQPGLRSGEQTEKTLRRPGRRYVPGQVVTSRADGAAMVYVPPGKFRMGRETGLGSERPEHTVRVTRGYFLYRTPVTNAQYRRFIQATGHPEPRCPISTNASVTCWEDARFNGPGQPVVGMTWSDALAYCKWAHMRLPTEAEWEFAARGADGRTYPWGDDEPDTSRHPSGQQGPRPVGAILEEAGPFGALDLVGNVGQWCADYTGDYPADVQVDPVGPADGILRVVRGGRWTAKAAGLRASTRYRMHPDNATPWIGFRPAHTEPLEFKDPVRAPGSSTRDQ